MYEGETKELTSIKNNPNHNKTHRCDVDPGGVFCMGSRAVGSTVCRSGSRSLGSSTPTNCLLHILKVHRSAVHE